MSDLLRQEREKAIQAEYSEKVKAALCRPGANHFDAGKPRHDLIPDLPMDAVAFALAHGAVKYGDDNWRRGMAWRRLIGSARRHILAFSRGEDTDPESGLPHLAHAICNLLMLLEYVQTGTGYDDRYKPILPPEASGAEKPHSEGVRRPGEFHQEQAPKPNYGL